MRLRRDFVAVGETCYACYLAGVDFMLPFAPLFFLRRLKYAWARGVCLRTAVGLFFVSRPRKKLGGRVVKIGAIGGRRAGFVKLEALRNAPGYPGLRLAQLHSFAAPSISPATCCA